MKRASIYNKNGKMFAHSLSMTTSGVWILSDPCFMFDQNDTVENIGECVLNTLNGSKEGIPHPISWKGNFDPILKLARESTWESFSKGAQLYDVGYDGEIISFTPYANLGKKEGFEAKMNETISKKRLSATMIGETVRQLFGT